jgi:hypothetical protein
LIGEHAAKSSLLAKLAKTMMSNSGNNIEWTVPKEWHMRKVRAELSGIITFRSLTRIILVSVALAIGIWYCAEKALGPLDFNWIRAIVISVVAGLGALLVGAAAACVPPNIRVSANGIDVLKGQGAFRVPFKDLVAISIQASAPAVLTFRKWSRDYRYAIAQSVDLEWLRQELERLSGRPVQIMQAGQGGPADASQPIRSETNETRSAAGSRR